jgi:hypothetical protein
MSAISKKKMCWNCEGRVALADENCPYCGVYLSTSSLINQQDESATHIAPYRPGSDKSIPASPYGVDKQEENEEEDIPTETIQEEALNPNQKSYLLPCVLLLSGSVFFVFGLILLAFSSRGTLTLQWNASYWFAYLGVATMLLFMGWRSLQNLKP